MRSPWPVPRPRWMALFWSAWGRAQRRPCSGLPVQAPVTVRSCAPWPTPWPPGPGFLKVTDQKAKAPSSLTLCRRTPHSEPAPPTAACDSSRFMGREQVNLEQGAVDGPSPVRGGWPCFGVRGAERSGDPALADPSKHLSRSARVPLGQLPGQLPGRAGRDSSRSLSRKPKRRRRFALSAHSIFRGALQRLLATRVGSWPQLTSTSWRLFLPMSRLLSEVDGPVLECGGRAQRRPRCGLPVQAPVTVRSCAPRPTPWPPGPGFLKVTDQKAKAPSSLRSAGALHIPRRPPGGFFQLEPVHGPNSHPHRGGCSYP